MKAFITTSADRPEKVKRCRLALLSLALIALLGGVPTTAAQTGEQVRPEKVILDTDIGDDIDDAFALALALRSPELQILQINSDFGNTALRTRLLRRFLRSVGRSDIPVSTGYQTPMDENHFTQRRYAEREQSAADPPTDAVTSTLAQIRKYPGEITLIAIGPLANIRDMIGTDPQTFRKLKRVVMMGGSIYPSDGAQTYARPRGPDPEWNIVQDISGAQNLLASGVPVYMMPLDATRLQLDEVKREALFKDGTPLTDQLLLLYTQWGPLTPVLFDAMAVSYTVRPDLCPTKAMRIDVDAAGYTRVQPGPPNVNVCLHSDPEAFFTFYMGKLLNQSTGR